MVTASWLTEEQRLIVAYAISHQRPSRLAPSQADVERIYFWKQDRDKSVQILVERALN